MNVKTSKGAVRVTAPMIAAADGSTAKAAATAIARRIYGRSGLCVTLRHDSDTIDRQSRIVGSTWEADIGRPAPDGGYTVSSVWIYT